MIILVTNNRELFPSSHFSIASVNEAISWLNTLSEISLDTETTGLDSHINKIICLQLGNKERQYIIDCSSIDVIQFKSLLESKRIVGHNLKFDLKFLFSNGICPTSLWDTFVTEKVLHCGLPHIRCGLDVVTERYLGFRLDKSVRDKISKEGMTTRVIQYAAEDIRSLEDIKNAQMSRLEEKDLIATAEFENKFTPALAYIEWCGFHLDPVRWKEKMDKDNRILAQTQQDLNDWVIRHSLNKYYKAQLSLFEPVSCSINWSSPKQVIPLFEELGISCTVVEKGELKKSVEAHVLEKQADSCELIPLYLKYKKAQKVVGTYGKSFLDQINPVTGRIHTSFTQIMDTGRISSGGKDKTTGSEYINFQNIPRDKPTRACFTSETGNVLIISDFTGQEQIVLANRCMDKNLLQFYDEGLADMHSFVASKMYPELEGLDLQEIKSNHSDKRSNAKGAGLSINYGGTGRTISDSLNLPLNEGERIFQAYFEAFPGLESYFNAEKQHGLRRGYILISELTGRKSFLPYLDKYRELEQQLTAEFWQLYRLYKEQSDPRHAELRKIVKDYFYYKGETERKSLNFPIQGTSAEITKLACIYLFKWILKNTLFEIVKICNVIHDEIVVECPDELSPQVAKVVKSAMCKAAEVYCKRVPLTADPDISTYWRK